VADGSESALPAESGDRAVRSRSAGEEGRGGAGEADVLVGKGDDSFATLMPFVEDVEGLGHEGLQYSGRLRISESA
jgi:hypothetical protein